MTQILGYDKCEYRDISCLAIGEKLEDGSVRIDDILYGEEADEYYANFLKEDKMTHIKEPRYKMIDNVLTARKVVDYYHAECAMYCSGNLEALISRNGNDPETCSQCGQGFRDYQCKMVVERDMSEPRGIKGGLLMILCGLVVVILMARSAGVW